MTLWKQRADAQDRYRRASRTATIVACHEDGTCDLALPGIAEVLCGVANASGVQYQAGNRVVVQRVGERAAWQIQAPAAGGAPGARLAPEALLPPTMQAVEDLARAIAPGLCALLANAPSPALPPGLVMWAVEATGPADLVLSATLPAPCRHLLLGARQQLHAGAASYALSGDGGQSWGTALPWERYSAALPSSTWHVRVTLTGDATLERVGLVGLG